MCRRAASVATVVVLSTGLLVPLGIAHAATTVPLGTAESFAILAHTTITNTGATVVTGDVGLHPGTAVTGFGPGADSVTMSGSLHVDDGVAQRAKDDLDTAYTNAAGQTPVTRVATELGNTTLTAGVYDSASGTFGVTGPLTLDGEGDPDAVFIFQMESTLVTASASSMNLIGDADACNVFWQVGSSATLGADSVLRGTIMALASITLETRANVEGRVLARTGAVTLDTNTITRTSCPAATIDDDDAATDDGDAATDDGDAATDDGDAATDDGTTGGGDGTTSTTSTTGGDTTTSQVRDVPRGAVAAGEGRTSSGAGRVLPLLAGMVLLAVVSGAIGNIDRRRSRA